MATSEEREGCRGGRRRYRLHLCSLIVGSADRRGLLIRVVGSRVRHLIHDDPKHLSRLQMSCAVLNLGDLGGTDCNNKKGTIDLRQDCDDIIARQDRRQINDNR